MLSSCLKTIILLYTAGGSKHGVCRSLVSRQCTVRTSWTGTNGETCKYNLKILLSWPSHLNKCIFQKQNNNERPSSWVQIFAVFWILYTFFWVIPRRLLHAPTRGLHVGRYPPQPVSVLWTAPNLSPFFLLAQVIFDPNLSAYKYPNIS